MNQLRIADAFEQPQIEAKRLEQITERLKTYAAETIKTGPAYNADTGVYYARFYDQGHLLNPKQEGYREPIEITETELYAVQQFFKEAGDTQARDISVKLEEAVRRIDDAKAYIAEAASRPAKQQRRFQ